MSELKNELEQVLGQHIDIEQIFDNRNNEEIPKKGKAYSLDCSIMFVDMRGSTKLTNDTTRRNMVKVYKALARVVLYATKENDGKVKQIVGDGFLCLFVKDGRKAAHKAIECAMDINTNIEKELNPLLSKNKIRTIGVGIGICSGNILLAKADKKGMNTVPLFVGSSTNYASKYCKEAKKNEVIIDNETYSQLDNEKKEWFVERDDYSYKAENCVWE